jgi:short-subunit dehydrogenase
MNKVLITGISRGIGKALVDVFTERGDEVVGYKRSKLGDVREMSTIGKLVRLAKDKDVNILINNAGVYSSKNITETTLEEIKEIIEINLLSHMLVTKALWKILVNNRGTVININSIAGRIKAGREIAYRTSKIGLTGFSDSLVYDGIKCGVRIIDIPLNGVNTDMLREREPLTFEHQQPLYAAKLIIKILNSNQTDKIVDPLISRPIIDSFVEERRIEELKKEEIMRRRQKRIKKYHGRA